MSCLSKNKSTLNKSTNSNSTKIKSQTTAPTVFVALNKLKSQQQKVLEEYKRFQVLNRQISKEHIITVNKQRQNEHFSLVKYSAQRDMEIKKEHEKKQLQELKQRYQSNIRNRQQNKKMINNVKNSFRDVHHELYQQIRKKKEQNQNRIKSQKIKELENKIINRMQAKQQESIRKSSIQYFYDSRIRKHRSSKQKEIDSMIKKSEEKHKMFNELAIRNSRIRFSKLNNSRISSNASVQQS